MEHFNTNLCEQCDKKIRGLCCFHFVEFQGKKFILTAQPCKFLDIKTKKCKIYDDRFKKNPNCLTIKKGLESHSLPVGCLYIPENERYDKMKWKRLPELDDGYHANFYYNHWNRPTDEIEEVKTELDCVMNMMERYNGCLECSIREACKLYDEIESLSKTFINSIHLNEFLKSSDKWCKIKVQVIDDNG